MLNKREPLTGPQRNEAFWLTHYLDLDFYQQVACSTAIYPRDRAVEYPMVGLAGEAGEMLNKLKKTWRDNTELDHADTIKELGDCLWYIAVIADDIDVNLSDLAHINVMKLLDRQERGVIGGSGDNR